MGHFTHACWMWDDYSQLGAKRLDGCLFSHIPRAIVESLLIIPEGIESKCFCAKAIFECQVHKKGYVFRKTMELRRWWVLQDYLILSTGLIMWIGHRKEIRKLTFRAVSLRRSDDSLRRRSNARNQNIKFIKYCWFSCEVIIFQNKKFPILLKF